MTIKYKFTLGYGGYGEYGDEFEEEFMIGDVVDYTDNDKLHYFADIFKKYQ